MNGSLHPAVLGDKRVLVARREGVHVIHRVSSPKIVRAWLHARPVACFVTRFPPPARGADQTIASMIELGRPKGAVRRAGLARGGRIAPPVRALLDGLPYAWPCLRRLRHPS